MRINLIPKSKEEERKVKAINFITTFTVFVVLSVVLVLSLVLLSFNFIKNNTVGNLKKDISETKKNIEEYAELEKNVTSMVSGLESIKQITGDRPQYEKLYKEIEKFMPKETFLKEMAVSEKKVTFKVKTISVEKVAEFIESLRNYEFVPESEKETGTTIKEISETTGTVKEGESTLGTSKETKKVKLFQDIEISNYKKEMDKKTGATFYMFDVEAQFTEDVWKK